MNREKLSYTPPRIVGLDDGKRLDKHFDAGPGARRVFR